MLIQRARFLVFPVVLAFGVLILAAACTAGAANPTPTPVGTIADEDLEKAQNVLTEEEVKALIEQLKEWDRFYRAGNTISRVAE